VIVAVIVKSEIFVAILLRRQEFPYPSLTGNPLALCSNIQQNT
jgi:hypothetical protein